MKRSITELLSTLIADIRTLLKQEVMLVKAEVSEKVQHMRGNVLALAISGSAAYAGMIVVLIGFGLLLGWVLTIVGLAPMLAAFIGLLVMGLLISGSAGIVFFKALHALSKESLVPEKSLEALQHMKEIRSPTPVAHVPESGMAAEAKLSSEELKQVAFATEEMLDQTLDELEDRVSPRQIAWRIKQRVKAHPYRLGVIGLGTGLLVFLGRRFKRA
jgi:uncharacterized membrane protein YkgB